MKSTGGFDRLLYWSPRNKVQGFIDWDREVLCSKSLVLGDARLLVVVEDEVALVLVAPLRRRRGLHDEPPSLPL